MATEAQKIKRSKFATFLNTGTKAAPVWSRFGKGVTEQTVDYGTNVTEEQYIDEDSARSSVEGYKLNIPSPMTAFVGDPIFDFVDELRIQRRILSEAETECLFVYLYKDEESGAYPAEKMDCAIKINSFGGPANESVKLDYDVVPSGDPVHGMFNPATKTFTEEDE